MAASASGLTGMYPPLAAIASRFEPPGEDHGRPGMARLAATATRTIRFETTYTIGARSPEGVAERRREQRELDDHAEHDQRRPAELQIAETGRRPAGQETDDETGEDGIEDEHGAIVARRPRPGGTRRSHACQYHGVRPRRKVARL